MIWGLVAAIAGAVLFGVAAVAQAHGVRGGEATMEDPARFLRAAVAHPVLLAVLAAYLAGFALHAVSIYFLPLYLAQATISLSLPVTAVTAGLIEDHPSPRAWAAIVAVVVGLAVLALGSGTPGEVTSGWAFAIATWLVLIALFVASRQDHRAAILGTLAGVAYAGSAIAVRGIGWPLSGPTIAAAIALPLFGGLGFWLYSRGLADDAVHHATVPMIIGQVGIPTVIGIASLGDGVRSWPLLILGLTLSTAGGLAVSRSPAATATESATDPG